MSIIRYTKGTEKVVSLIEKLLDQSITSKDEIVQRVMEELGTPKPTIRRIMKDMRDEMTRKIQILQADKIPLPE